MNVSLSASAPRYSRWWIFPLSCLFRQRERRGKKNNPQHRLLNIIIRARNYESVRGGAKKNHKHAPATLRWLLEAKLGQKCAEKNSIISNYNFPLRSRLSWDLWDGIFMELSLDFPPDSMMLHNTCNGEFMNPYMARLLIFTFNALASKWRWREKKHGSFSKCPSSSS